MAVVVAVVIVVGTMPDAGGRKRVVIVVDGEGALLVAWGAAAMPAAGCGGRHRR